MAKSYEGKAPLTMVRCESPASYASVLAGAPVPENIAKDDLKRLLDEGFLVEAAKAEEPTDDSKPTKVDDVLAEVGDDKEKAAAALEAENASEKPRVSLVSKLQAVLDAKA